jgi:hypothetical protein
MMLKPTAPQRTGPPKSPFVSRHLSPDRIPRKSVRVISTIIFASSYVSFAADAETNSTFTATSSKICFSASMYLVLGYKQMLL